MTLLSLPRRCRIQTSCSFLRVYMPSRHRPSVSAISSSDGRQCKTVQDNDQKRCHSLYPKSTCRRQNLVAYQCIGTRSRNAATSSGWKAVISIKVVNNDFNVQSKSMFEVYDCNPLLTDNLNPAVSDGFRCF